MRFQTQRGFTVVDLLVTLAIVTILGAAVLPSVVNKMRTYRRTMATRLIVSEIRKIQSLSVSRTGIFALEWSSPSRYRVVRDLTGSCGFPAADAPQDDTDVVRGWLDLSADYPEVSVASVEDRDGRNVHEIMFDSLGSSVNSCGSVSFPLTITVSDGSGGTDFIEVARSGLARRL